MNKRILLIEDDAYVLDLYKTVLTKAGYDLSVAEDGQKAVEIAKSEQFDLILLDIMLPRLTGLEVLRRFREEISLTKETPVYLLTNLGEENVIQEAYKIGANGYLLKAKYLPKQIVDEIDKFFMKTNDKDGKLSDNGDNDLSKQHEEYAAPSDSK